MAFDETQLHPETLATFALMEIAPGTIERYAILVEDTLAYQRPLVELGLLRGPRPVYPNEAAHFLRFTFAKIPPEHRDETIGQRWMDWEKEYDAIFAASPKLRLKEAISDVAETVSCMSWPKRWERTIWEWAVSSKSGEECPFYRYRERLGESHRLRIAELVREIDGFLYCSEDTGQVEFVPTEGLPAIWRHQEHIAAIERNKPFGFLHDASRPDMWKHTRPPTEAEERFLAAKTRKKQRSGLFALLSRLRR